MAIPKIIDVHTHIFNLNYLPVRGVLQAYGTPYPIAVAVAFIFRQFTNKPSSIKSDKRFFDESLDSFPLEYLKADEAIVINHIASGVSREIFFHPTVQDNIQDAIDQGYLSLDDESLTMVKGLKEIDIDIDEKIFRIIKKVLALLKDGFHYLKWFFFMMRSEKSIVEMLLRSYGDDVDHFVFHMIDSHHFFNGRSRLRIKDQINRMKALMDKHNGKLIGFVPFNPKRRTAKGIKLVKYGLDRGFTGVKFYPPLGYRATSNEECIAGYPDVKNGRKLEKRIHNFFRFCVKEGNDIPVFTHCTPTGFQANPKEKSGRNADPMFWERLLSKPKFNTLRVCLGHAGGEQGWETANDADFDQSYAKKVYELCITYPNVYCEVGFLAHIKKGVPRQNFIKRLQDLFLRDEGEYSFFDKVMYGSDWHILFNDGIQLAYHKEFLSIFENAILKDYKEQFFFLNAQRYLKI
ncbi:amidohydrolase family protein [Aquimarina longa]|uniref:amidohydrolase family protein n=1 Tax=Aquimarina longa TaxID=1080221 RepID=UPI000781C149|nr:amidohydrolase family protein [Aquimarina longa]